MTIIHFKTAKDFHDWLSGNHDQVKELHVGIYKKNAGLAGLSYAKALDEALCFGWIDDGVRNPVDDRHYTLRFSPRKPKSLWTPAHVQRAEQLVKRGRMTPAGLKAFRARAVQDAE